jgi:hypothetical protein
MTARSTIVRYLPGPPPVPVDAPELHALAEYVRAGRCALFVGAGLSASAGLPTWGALMQRLVERVAPWGVDAGIVPSSISIVDDADDAWKDDDVVAVKAALGAERFDHLFELVRRRSGTDSVPHALALLVEVVGRDSAERAELARLLEQRRYPELAGYCRERMGAPAFEEQMREALVPTRGLPGAHRHIVRTPFACVVTTNFDTLLEQAYTEYGGQGTPRAPTGADLAQLGTLLLDSSFFILKAHGDALRPETMIFSADDYRRVIHSTPAFQAVFSGILMTHAVLFVGYSLSDTNFRLLLDQQLTVFNGQVPPRYALLSGVGGAEEDILWRTARLQVLSYPQGEHQHVEQFLGALADATARPADDGTTAPPATSRRARPEPAPERSPADAILAIGVREGQLTLRLERREPHDVHAAAAAVPARRLREIGAAIREAIDVLITDTAISPGIANVGAQLAKLVPATLLRRLGALEPGAALELICADGTHRFPWEWLMIGGELLCDRLALSRRSVALPDAARGYRTITRTGRALIIGDAGSGTQRLYAPLEGAEHEGRTIAARLRRRMRRGAVTLLSREQATRARILDELRTGSYDIVHFGGHAWFTERESYFWTWDQLMLGSELTPLLSRRPPSLLVMSTHFTSFVPLGFDEDFRATLLDRSMSLADLAMQQSAGFAEVAMRCGVASFVGSFGQPPDLDTAELMIAFYEEMLAGKTAAGALLDARRRHARQQSTSRFIFALTGHGDLRLPTRTSR